MEQSEVIMRLETNGPQRKKLAMDCEAWSGWVKSLCHDVDVLIAKVYELELEIEEMKTRKCPHELASGYNDSLGEVIPHDSAEAAQTAGKK